MSSQSTKDLRWLQRFSNYQKALTQLNLFIAKKNNLNELEEQGLIKSFEYTYELAWNTMKDFYESQGEANIQGSRDAIRLAFKRGMIENGQEWIDMVDSRIQTAHTYDKNTAKEVVEAVLNRYADLFTALQAKLETLKP
jgi:nucleotidyltransferase substrate binding protein (TIGR01987 family)